MIDNLKNIIFFSDLHFGGKHGEDAHAARLADAIVGTLDPNTSLVVLCGDLVDDPTPEAIAACARWIERLETAGIAVVAVVGNHGCARWGFLGVHEGLRAQVVLSLVTARPGVQGDLIEPPWWYDTDNTRVILLDSQWGLRGWDRRPDLARGRISASLGQVLQSTALHMADELDLSVRVSIGEAGEDLALALDRSLVLLFDPQLVLLCAARYMRWQLDRYDEGIDGHKFDFVFCTGAYNAGSVKHDTSRLAPNPFRLVTFHRWRTTKAIEFHNDCYRADIRALWEGA